MLLFILVHLLHPIVFSDFNTSHVTVYLLFSIPSFFANFNFNTSHVTVYQNKSAYDIAKEIFQYISCYCLSTCKSFFYIVNEISIHLMLLFICFSAIIHCFCLHFNTSHVTVYPESRTFDRTTIFISIHLMLLFISCWKTRQPT